jgi:type I restriction-modification system DNA methylase subunit
VASDVGDTERRLWSIADQLRANSGLKPSEYSRPVLGLLFLRYADGRFAEAENLRAQRDLLLPKLISGEIDVSATPLQLEAAE